MNKFTVEILNSKSATIIHKGSKLIIDDICPQFGDTERHPLKLTHEDAVKLCDALNKADPKISWFGNMIDWQILSTITNHIGVSYVYLEERNLEAENILLKLKE